MTRYFLGVDIGNTKSHALICDETGHVLGVGITGPGNHEWLKKEGFLRILREVINLAVQSAGINLADIVAAGYGIAGYDWSEDLPLMREVIESLDFSVPYGLMNDSGPGLLAGSSNGWGISVSAGTSVNARGRTADGREARMTGNGLLFGEYGGGSEIVYRAIGEISRAWSLRGKPTMLTDLFLDYVGATDVEDFLAGIARERYRVGSKDAPLVFRAAEAGDEVAINVVRWIGEGLGDITCGMIRQLDIANIAFDVVLSGSIYKGSPLILETMRKIVCEMAPRARFVHLSAPPVTGAVLMGMEQVGLDFMPIRDRIITEGEALLLANKDSD